MSRLIVCECWMQNIDSADLMTGYVMINVKGEIYEQLHMFVAG